MLWVNKQLRQNNSTGVIVKTLKKKRKEKKNTSSYTITKT